MLIHPSQEKSKYTAVAVFLQAYIVLNCFKSSPGIDANPKTYIINSITNGPVYFGTVLMH